MHYGPGNNDIVIFVYPHFGTILPLGIIHVVAQCIMVRTKKSSLEHQVE